MTLNNPFSAADADAATQDRIEDLVKASDSEFERAVTEWVDIDNADDDPVFLDAALVERTFRVTGALILRYEGRIRQTPNADAQAAWLELITKLGVKKKRARTIRAEVRAAKQQNSSRQQAMRVLANVFPAEFTRARKLVEGGHTAKEVEKILREEIANR